MICEVCGGDFPHGGGIDHCLTYGGRVMCLSCMLRQPVCADCGRHRHGAFMVEGLCEECHQLRVLVRLQRDAVRVHIEEAIPRIVTDEEFFDNFEDEDEEEEDRPPLRRAGIGIERVMPPPEERITWGDPPPTEMIRRRYNYTIPEAPPQRLKSGRCDMCGDHSSTLRLIPTGHHVCEACMHQTGTCGICEEVRLLRDGVCRKCAKENPRGIENNWRYRPPHFKKWGHSEDKLYFGIENEVECTVTKAHYLKNIARHYFFDEAYTMHDGTIDYGTEVVMHPRTFESLKKFNFDPMLDGIRPHQNTGMHVHLSREAFSNKMHLYKFMRFFVKNKGFIEFIAERRSKLYRAWEFTDREQVIAKCKGYEVGEGKYIDVNLRHAETIEVRIFKGATTRGQIMKNVEFCHALWEFSKTHVPKKMTRFQFERWLKGQSGYPNLAKFIEGRNK